MKRCASHVKRSLLYLEESVDVGYVAGKCAVYVVVRCSSLIKLFCPSLWRHSVQPVAPREVHQEWLGKLEAFQNPQHPTLPLNHHLCL